MRPEFTNDEDAFHAFNDLMTETDGDPEEQHGAADEFVRDLLHQHGFTKLALTYTRHRQGWWYA